MDPMVHQWHPTRPTSSIMRSKSRSLDNSNLQQPSATFQKFIYIDQNSHTSPSALSKALEVCFEPASGAGRFPQNVATSTIYYYMYQIIGKL